MKLFTLATFLLLSHLVFGQDSLKTVQLEEIAVVAVRASDQAPVSQSTVNRPQIQEVDLGQDAAITLEKLTPSIISYSDAGSNYGNYNQIRLRGIDQTRINITLNGVPLNDMMDQGVFFSNFTDFSSSIQSFQVQRGVGVSTNGTSSYAGSINYESINLDQVGPSGEVNFTGGSFGTLRFNAAANTGRMKNDLAVYTRISRTISDGYKYHSGSNAQSMFVSAGKFFEKSLLKLTAFAGKTQNEQAYLPVLLNDIKADPKTNYFSRNDTDDFEQELIQLQYSTQLNTNLNWSSTLYYGGARGYFPFFDGFFNSQTIYALQNDRYGLISTMDFVGNNFRLSGGVHGYLFDRSNETAIAPDVSNLYYSDRSEKNEVSLFGKAAFDINQLTLFADVQLRSVNMRFISDTLMTYAGNKVAKRDEVFFNPKVGITYHFSKTSNAYLSYGRTGREPTRTDLLQGDFNSAISAFNFQAFSDQGVIQSEFVNDFEIGYRYTSSKYKWAINAFHMNFENEISIVGGLTQNSYVPLRQNVESSSRSGIELEFQYNLNDQFSFGLTSTYMETNVDAFNTGLEVLNDVEHAFAPKIMIAPSINYLILESLSIGFDGRYVSESFMELGNDPNYLLPSYFVANGKINWNISENMSLGAWVNNLFDKQYFTDGAPVDLDYDGTPEGPGYRIQPPRNFLFSLNISF